jgi:hypothetical protein
MGLLVVIIVVVALLIGGIGLLVEGLLWLLAIAALILVVGALLGWRGRSNA